MTNLTLRSDADQINMFLAGKSGETKLSPALAEKLQRLMRVADLLARDKDPRIVAGKLSKLWPDECSPATAYRWIGEAQEVFATEALQSRAFYVNTLLADVAQTRKMAVVAQDLKAMAACDKTLATIIEKFMGSNESLPIDKLQAPRLFFSFDPEKAGAALPDNWEAQVQQLMKKRKKTGVVADHADFQDAQIVDETNSPGAPLGLDENTPKK